MDAPPVMPTERPPDWWDRNWKWFLPTIVLGIMGSATVVIGGFAWIIFGILKDSEPYKMGLDLARGNPALVQALGEPIESGWFASGNIHISGSSGDADLDIPLHGPKGKASLYLLAERELGTWHITTAVAKLDGSRNRIDLLAESQPAP